MNKFLKYFISIYQIIGGIMGFLFIYVFNFVIKFKVNDKNPFALDNNFILIIGLLMFSLSLLAGILLITNKKIGVTTSLVNQYLQVINLSLTGFQYNFITGILINPKLRFGGDQSMIGSDFIVFSKFNLFFNSYSQGISLTLNLMPILLIIFLYRMNKRVFDKSFT
ncbi:hypothetical protein KZ483_26890 [Paenibacillus sp. sptzw28]|uniref:hypothetical protein n=1 Tax=Paenibacillus sp. sptzw28 TaxID=715179 RepID=UPI001C6DDF6C|nr:hypothetical protein [Paenibacillus sp. sptzw28]QYR21265.1 hypothetical protein KZ483_26890 [Paenibacillus sp. sptzw28]